MPYYIGDLKGDPNLENYPNAEELAGVSYMNNLPGKLMRAFGHVSLDILSPRTDNPEPSKRPSCL